MVYVRVEGVITLNSESPRARVRVCALTESRACVCADRVARVCVR